MGKTEQKFHIKIESSSEQLARKTHDYFIQKAKASILARGAFYFALSGGHTPESLFKMLGQSEDAYKLPWDKMHAFWVDERCVSPDADESNFKHAWENFLSLMPVPETHVHRVKGESPDPHAAAKEYEQEIFETFKIGRGQIPQFDLILLGMGADGHTGSLFPGSFAPFETDELCIAVYMLNSRASRITMTIPVLLNASELLVLVSGADKAQTLERVLIREPDAVTYPIHGLWPALDRILWMVDKDAAALLPADVK